jgi:mono/diheme cytochrome c family protein
MAFHPGTGLVYIPSQEMPYPFHVDPDFDLVPGAFNTGEDFAAMARSLEGYERALRFCEPTHLTAWDPVAGHPVWRVAHRSEIQGGALATAGNLVFKSSGDGELAAFRATDGERLWAAEVGIAVMAPPVTYAVGGVQYVAVMVGAGGSAGMNFATLDYANAGYAIAWRLDGEARLPAVAPREVPAPSEAPFAPDPEAARRGHALYHRHCFRCHGVGTKSGGLLPDLRRSPPEVHAQWEAIVLSGTRADRGMASFADVLGREDVRDIHAYVVTEALREPGLVPRVAAWLAERGLCVPGAWIAD